MILLDEINISTDRHQTDGPHTCECTCRDCLFISQMPIRKTITQKLYQLKHCLANSLGFLLSNSYILNQPICTNLCITEWKYVSFGSYTASL
ncbi:hypothetical protein ACRRTK_004233 [Alexandromys fortis]